ncbi:MAG TPA: hypothetical protein VLA77_01040 [Candidatus Saccharimonadales bacterium]|nr:hypothetical protein [Candidatus Saccharimonadales bacterium]
MAKRKKKRGDRLRRVLSTVSQGFRFSLKWRYLLWATICAFVILVVANRVTLAHWLDGVDWVLIKDYLAVIITWPTAILVLGLVFMYRFSEAIRVFLSKIDRLKAVGVELSQQQSVTPPTPTDSKEQKTVEDLESKVDDGSVTLTKRQVDNLVTLLETMDFRFLNLHLVQNTKNALRVMTQSEVRKSAFLQVYQVPPQLTDPVTERQAILNALFDAGLIHEESDILKATEKGVRFLAFIGTPVQQAR